MLFRSIKVIGATTIDEYRKYIEKNAALERRFQPILVNEPSVEDTYDDTNLSLIETRFQAEDGIRDCLVTGVQTCALPI